VYNLDESNGHHQQQLLLQQQRQQAQDFAAWSYGNQRTPIYATSPRPPKDVTMTTTSGYSGEDPNT
jgi:hypothetical protein